MNSNSPKAVFFDRDGVLNRDIGYLFDPAKVEWLPGAVESLAELNRRRITVVVVTNQSGVARGFYTEDDVAALHDWMNRDLAAAGAHIDAFYFCPHHPEGIVSRYAVECDWRKPSPGMLLTALRELELDPDSSVLVGDRPSDVAAAEAAGVKGLLFPGGNLHDFLLQENIL